ncbi:MAG: hypothetical protein JKY48_07225 [Flavobacteriales bacterium]|nr:hypothetical protein [Flavobacteriales bacterium]
MPIYREKENKLNLTVSDSDNIVSIEIECQNGTIASAAFTSNAAVNVTCGNSATVSTASNLKDDYDIFSCIASNPNGDEIKVVHTIKEANGQEIKYTFPDDYTGSTPYNTTDLTPSYEFTVNFN